MARLSWLALAAFVACAVLWNGASGSMHVLDTAEVLCDNDVTARSLFRGSESEYSSKVCGSSRVLQHGEMTMTCGVRFEGDDAVGVMRVKVSDGGAPLFEVVMGVGRFGACGALLLETVPRDQALADAESMGTPPESATWLASGSGSVNVLHIIGTSSQTQNVTMGRRVVVVPQGSEVLPYVFLQSVLLDNAVLHVHKRLIANDDPDRVQGPSLPLVSHASVNARKFLLAGYVIGRSSFDPDGPTELFLLAAEAEPYLWLTSSSVIASEHSSYSPVFPQREDRRRANIEWTGAVIFPSASIAVTGTQFVPSNRRSPDAWARVGFVEWLEADRTHMRLLSAKKSIVDGRPTSMSAIGNDVVVVGSAKHGSLSIGKSYSELEVLATAPVPLAHGSSIFLLHHQEVGADSAVVAEAESGMELEGAAVVATDDGDVAVVASFSGNGKVTPSPMMEVTDSGELESSMLILAHCERNHCSWTSAAPLFRSEYVSLMPTGASSGPSLAFSAVVRNAQTDRLESIAAVATYSDDSCVCEWRRCGEDGCGGSCGGCEEGLACGPDQLCHCDSQCHVRECGGDGCGGSCGTCDTQFVCNDGMCEAPPVVVRTSHFFKIQASFSFTPSPSESSLFDTINERKHRYQEAVVATMDGDLSCVEIVSWVETTRRVQADIHVYTWRAGGKSTTEMSLVLLNTMTDGDEEEMREFTSRGIDSVHLDGYEKMENDGEQQQSGRVSESGGDEALDWAQIGGGAAVGFVACVGCLLFIIGAVVFMRKRRAATLAQAREYALMDDGEDNDAL